MADSINRNLKEAYENATPETEVKPPPPGGHLHKDTKGTIKKSKSFAKDLKWASVNGKWSPERLEKAKKKLKIIKKSYTWRMKKDREVNEIRRLETSEQKNKNFFEHMKSATKKKATKTDQVKVKNGIFRTSDPEVAEAFSEELGDQLKSGEPVDVNWNENHPFDQTEETLSQVYISPDAVRRHIKKANCGAAPRPDGIPMEVFAEGCDVIAEPLAML